MFGYHNDPACMFDIWSPNERSAIENRAFSAYCQHTSECDNVVDRIVEGNVHIVLDENFDENDLNYIKNRLQDEYDIDVDFTIS